MKEVLFDRTHSKYELDAKVAGNASFAIIDGTIYIANDGNGLYYAKGESLLPVGETNRVASVQGHTGAVTLTKADLVAMGIDSALLNTTLAALRSEFTSNVYKYIRTVDSYEALLNIPDSEYAELKTGYVYNVRDSEINYAAVLESASGTKYTLPYDTSTNLKYRDSGEQITKNIWTPNTFDIGWINNNAAILKVVPCHSGVGANFEDNTAHTDLSGRYVLVGTHQFSGMEPTAGAQFFIVGKSSGAGTAFYEIACVVSGNEVTQITGKFRWAGDIGVSCAKIYRNVWWDALGGNFDATNLVDKNTYEANNASINQKIENTKTAFESEMSAHKAEVKAKVEEASASIATTAAGLVEQMNGFGSAAGLNADNRAGNVPRVGDISLTSFDPRTPVVINAEGSLVGDSRGELKDAAFYPVATGTLANLPLALVTKAAMDKAIADANFDPSVIIDNIPTIGTEAGNVPSIGSSLANRNGYPVVIDSAGGIKPWGNVLGSAAKCSEATSVEDTGLPNTSVVKEIISRQSNGFIVATAPAANNYSAGTTSNPPLLDAPQIGTRITVKFPADLQVTGNVELAVAYKGSPNAMLKKQLYCSGTNVGDRLKNGGIYEVVYDGEFWHILGGVGGKMYWQGE